MADTTTTAAAILAADIHAAFLHRGGVDDWMYGEHVDVGSGFEVYPTRVQAAGGRVAFVAHDVVNPDAADGWYWRDADDGDRVYFVAGPIDAEPVPDDRIVRLLVDGE